MMKLPAILSMFLFVGLWAIAALVPWDLPHGVTRAEMAACREEPHQDCLFDLGVALLLDERELTSSNSWLAHLSMSGRIDDAETVFRRLKERSGASPEEAVKSARRATGRYRLIEDLRAGAGLDAALEKVAEVDGGDLWLAGLELLGRHPFGGPVLVAPETPSEAERELAAALATRILAWNRASHQKARDYHLEYAAELRAALGDIPEILRCDVDMPGPLTVEPVPVAAVVPLREPPTAAGVRNRDEWQLRPATMQRPSPGPNVGEGPVALVTRAKKARHAAGYFHSGVELRLHQTRRCILL